MQKADAVTGFRDVALRARRQFKEKAIESLKDKGMGQHHVLELNIYTTGETKFGLYADRIRKSSDGD